MTGLALNADEGVSVSKLKVLVVDDSAFMRRVIKQMLESDPEIEVIGTARDGAEGVDMTVSLAPDVVTMDIEMPRMNGLDATKMIMEKLPTPIIMVSSLTEEGAKATFDALERGAVDYVAKHLDNSTFDIMKIQNELIGKVKAVARKSRRTAPAREERRVQTLAPARKGFITQKIAFVAIGASTGGPRAIQEIVSRLPGDMATPFLISVHMPKAFTKAFADRLNDLSKLQIKEVENNEPVMPGCVFVSQGGAQTRIKRRGATEFHIEISDNPASSLYKPSVDVSMQSVADCFPGRSMGVILTGMGHDGMQGMKLIKEKGGKTLAQNEETSVVYGMPKAVIDAGIADKIVPLDAIAAEIVNMI